MSDFLASSSAPGNANAARRLLMQKISQNENLPALGRTVARVVQLTSSDNQAQSELTYFILSDVGLTQKILRLANTVFYRTANSTAVTTISRAIFVLGFDLIKTSALAMLLVDRLSDRQHAHSIHAELLQALYASVIGREMARKSSYQGGEEAAISALFKNLGRLLMAAHDHALYSKLTGLIETDGLSPAQASMQVMGCSLEMLAESVLQEWQMPPAIIRSLAPLAAGVPKPAKNRQEWMQQVAAFSADAAQLLSRTGTTAAIERSATLLARYGEALNLDLKSLDQLFGAAGREINILRASMQLELEPVSTEPALAPTAKVVLPTLPDDMLMVCGNAAEGQIGSSFPSGKPFNASARLLAGMQDVTQVMASGRSKVNELILLAMETLYSSMGFDFAAFCIKDRKSGQYRARMTIGKNHIVRQAGFVLPLESTSDIFHLALGNDADLIIADATTSKIIALLPAWHRKLLADTRSFIVLPLVVRSVPLGLFYADRTTLAPEGVSPDEAALIKALKGQVLAALQAGDRGNVG
ncbi:MAG: HDOD domain-containing protein [Glaciimonas sp.]|nr:HDOD domain-containing protein [Glaciimonas sp.]